MDRKENIPLTLKKILSDKKSGSADLLYKLNSFFLKEAGNFPFHLRYIPILKKELAVFQAVVNYLCKLEKKKDKKSYLKFLTEVKLSEEEAYLRIFEKLSPLLNGHLRIVTLSNSRTVFRFLAHLKKERRDLTVIIAESRPRLEGRKLAAHLADAGIKTEFITDAMLAGYIAGCDCAIIGADKILKNGNIINKTGSLNAAILCKEFGKSLYVIAGKDKISKSVSFKAAQMPAVEVWKNKDKNISVVNYYFEEVERKYITKVITD